MTAPICVCGGTVDVLRLECSAERCAGSIPVRRTKYASVAGIGIHDGLKIRCAQALAGSIPATRTIITNAAMAEQVDVPASNSGE